MSDGGDLDELARRYLDLWQDQMSALANDPEMAEAIERVLHQWMGGPPNGAGGPAGAPPWPGPPAGMTGPGAGADAASFAWAWPAAVMAALQAAAPPGPAAQAGPWAGWAPQGTGDGRNAAAGADGAGAQSGAQAPGAAAAAGTSERGDLDVDQLLRRLAVLEERVAALERPESPSRSEGKSGKSKAGDRKRRS